MFDNGIVKVDRDFARIGSKSYAINKITSLDIRVRREPGQTGYRLFWIGAAVAAIHSAATLTPVSGLIAGILAIGGLPSFRKRHTRHLFVLVLLTAAGESQAYETADEEEASDIREAIEAAMTAR